MSQSNLSWDG